MKVEVADIMAMMPKKKTPICGICGDSMVVEGGKYKCEICEYFFGTSSVINTCSRCGSRFGGYKVVEKRFLSIFPLSEEGKKEIDQCLCPTCRSKSPCFNEICETLKEKIKYELEQGNYTGDGLASKINDLTSKSDEFIHYCLGDVKELIIELSGRYIEEGQRFHIFTIGDGILQCCNRRICLCTYCGKRIHYDETGYLVDNKWVKIRESEWKVYHDKCAAHKAEERCALRGYPQIALIFHLPSGCIERYSLKKIESAVLPREIPYIVGGEHIKCKQCGKPLYVTQPYLHRCPPNTGISLACDFYHDNCFLVEIEEEKKKKE